MRILGVDPGTMKFGMAMVEDDHGVPIVKYHEQVPLGKGILGERLSILYDHVLTQLKGLKIDLCSVEVPITYPGRVAGTGARGQGYGMVHTACYALFIPIKDIRPNEGKKALTGRGNANKALMVDAAIDLLGVDCGEDEADAIGIALAGWKKYNDIRLKTDN